MFILNQEANAPVTFIEFPKRGVLEAELIKKLLNYTKLDVSLNVLLKKDPKQDNKSYYFEIMRFKRLGWHLQMIYVAPLIGNLPHNFNKNKRAMDLLANSEQKSKLDIRGNVLIIGCYQNEYSICHPYFLSDQLSNQSFVIDDMLDDKNKNSSKKSFAGGDNTQFGKSSKIPKISGEDRVF